MWKKKIRNIGNLLFRTGKFNEAIENYKLAVKSDPKSAKAHNNFGTALMFTGNIEAAISEFKKALLINPSYKKAQNNLDKAYSIMNP